MTFMEKLSASRNPFGKNDVNMAKISVADALANAKKLMEMQYILSFYIKLSINSAEIWERSDKLKELIDAYILSNGEDSLLMDNEIWHQLESKFSPIYEKSSEYVNLGLNSVPGLNTTDLANLKNLVNQFDIHYKNADLELRSKKSLIQLKDHIDSMGKRSMDIHKLCNGNMEKPN